MSKINTNTVIITGNLTRDVEVRYTANKTPVASFTVACNRQGQDNEQIADFFTCVLWGRSAETLEQYLKKGKSVLVKGRLQTRSYEGKDGQKRTITEIIADGFGGVELLGGGQAQNNQPQSSQPRTARNDWNPMTVEEPPARQSGGGETADIPF